MILINKNFQSGSQPEKRGKKLTLAKKKTKSRRGANLVGAISSRRYRRRHFNYLTLTRCIRPPSTAGGRFWTSFLKTS